MKIGILTFHWGTNYGAILQAYALQTYLEDNGHEVVIIHYKPSKYDSSLYKILTSRALLSLAYSIKNLKKEKELIQFRADHLHLTKRYRSIHELRNDPPRCDVYISGSDQVLNPSFTLYGEGRKSPASTYYLDFGDKRIKRFGYAVSFGCTKYPETAKQLARPLLKNFVQIGVRENSGIDILRSMDYTNSCITPDPTLLLNKNDYNKLLINYSQQTVECFMYMIHNRKFIVNKLKRLFPNSIIADEKNEHSMLAWISNIKNAKYIITNSFHGVVFCLHYHIPFVVLVESVSMKGGNDRFFTLLNPMGLTNRIIEESGLSKINNSLNSEINWQKVDSEIVKIRKNGISFLKNILTFNKD